VRWVERGVWTTLSPEICFCLSRRTQPVFYVRRGQQAGNLKNLAGPCRRSLGESLEKFASQLSDTIYRPTDRGFFDKPVDLRYPLRSVTATSQSP